VLRLFRRHREPEGGRIVTHGPPPMNPIEVGLALRSAREREDLSLEQVRDRTDVPKVDLDALERGQLETFHVEQAAVVALWRYAEAVGLDPNALIEVLHRFWSKPSLSIEALGITSDLGATPLAQLRLATSLLSPISRPRALTSGSRHLGLSKSMRDVLSSASIGATRAVATIGPGRLPKSTSGHGSGKGSSGKKRPGKSRSSKAALASSHIARLEAKNATAASSAVVQREPDANAKAAGPSSSEGATAHDDASSKHQSWPAQAAHVLAERFGIDHENDEGSSTDFPPLH